MEKSNSITPWMYSPVPSFHILLLAATRAGSKVQRCIEPKNKNRPSRWISKFISQFRNVSDSRGRNISRFELNIVPLSWWSSRWFWSRLTRIVNKPLQPFNAYVDCLLLLLSLSLSPLLMLLQLLILFRFQPSFLTHSWCKALTRDFAAERSTVTRPPKETSHQKVHRSTATYFQHTAATCVQTCALSSAGCKDAQEGAGGKWERQRVIEWGAARETLAKWKSHLWI